jgi:DDE family transposase
MAMGRRKDRARTPGLWIATNELPPTGGHPFYQRLNQVLDTHGFDEFVEAQCASFYAATRGRRSLTPGTYFRLLLIGYFEGIDSERGIAWRTADSLLRSIVRRDSGETYQEFLTRLAQASGIETPSRADLARLDRKRPKKGRNTEWRHPHDPDARITKMKDGRTRLAHKAEHAVDLETGAIVGVTVQGADDGDTTTIAETDEHTAVIEEVVADKGYHSNQVLVDFAALDLRTYIAEPDRGRRRRRNKTEARDAVYANRRRIRGARGRALQRRRSERLERPNAHLYETGGMRRTHLRGHVNILKRLVIHSGGFNLGLLMRRLIGVGTPRGLQGRLTMIVSILAALIGSRSTRRRYPSAASIDRGALHSLPHRFELLPVNVSNALLTTGC